MEEPIINAIPEGIFLEKTKPHGTLVIIFRGTEAFSREEQKEIRHQGYRKVYLFF